MNKRPLSVTVIGWLFIAAGIVGAAFHAMEFSADDPIDTEFAPILLVRLVAIVGGVFVLRGRNWARWLLLGWMAYHVVLSAFHTFSELAVHAVLLGVLAFFLLRPRVSAYFRGGRIEPAGLTEILLLIALPAMAPSGCSSDRIVPADGEPMSSEAVPAPEWTGLFDRERGWLAADGIYSVPVSGGRTLFLFSDTVLGDGRGERVSGLQFINNSAAVLRGREPDSGAIDFYWGQSAAGDTQAVFMPRTPSATNDQWYWLGDGFVNHQLGDSTFVFAYRMKRTEGSGIFNFAPDGVTLLILPPRSEPPFEDHVQRETDLFIPPRKGEREIVFGAAVLDNSAASGAVEADGYVYVYGINEENKGLVAARVRPEQFNDPMRWRFWDGEEWSASIADAATITTRVSNELSVTPLRDGRFLLAFQLDTIGDVIAIRLGRTPVGPFSEYHEVYRCPEAQEDLGSLDLFCYNAKAHPHLSDEGKLLISYNVNALGGGLEALRLAHRYYRPRFVRIDLN